MTNEAQWTPPGKAQWEINAEIRKAYHARIGAWAALLRPGDRVGITNSIFSEDRTLAKLGTVTSITPTGRINVIDEQGNTAVFLPTGTEHTSGCRDYLESPEALTESIARLDEEHRQWRERRALRKAWIAKIGWTTESHNHFMGFPQRMGDAHEVTPRLREHAKEIRRVLTAMGLAETVAEPSPVARTPEDVYTDPQVGDEISDTWSDDDGEHTETSRVIHVTTESIWTVWYLDGVENKVRQLNRAEWVFRDADNTEVARPCATSNALQAEVAQLRDALQVVRTASEDPDGDNSWCMVQEAVKVLDGPGTVQQVVRTADGLAARTADGDVQVREVPRAEWLRSVVESAAVKPATRDVFTDPRPGDKIKSTITEMIHEVTSVDEFGIDTTTSHEDDGAYGADTWSHERWRNMRPPLYNVIHIADAP